jgi:signal transduction histidine kinase
LLAVLAALGRVATIILLIALPAIAMAGKNVLVLYANNRLLPGNIAVDRGLREGVADVMPPVAVYSEFLDAPEFSGDAYAATMSDYLRRKYSLHPPDVIVAVSDDAVAFVLRYRDQIFPRVPVVYTLVSASTLQATPELPGDVRGITVQYDLDGTIAQAMRSHPKAKNLVVVTGSSIRDRLWEARFRHATATLAGKYKLEFLSGLPVAALQARLHALDATSVVVTIGFFEDGDGRLSTPRDAAKIIAEASNAPVYGPLPTFMGVGVVGGSMPSFDEAGQRTAQVLLDVLNGSPPAHPDAPEITPNHSYVDWRQVRRWGIDPDTLPAKTIVQFREPHFWEAYPALTALTIAIVLIQGTLIASLLVERQRRRTAELAVQAQRVALTHAARLAVAGELTASIAHEINQPLGAVQTNADAAEIILEAGGDRREDLLRIVSRIRHDNQRASEVIRRLRALLAKHDTDRLPVDLNTTATDVHAFLHAELLRRDMTLLIESRTRPALVKGDQTQLQQLMIILILNALDAMAEVSAGRRTVTVRIGHSGTEIEVVVQDGGIGIESDNIPRLFESFFSTKKTGMGLGLSIARTIVEAHGGRIEAANGAGGGAVFTVRLPAMEMAETATRS